jgi:hypothetical protein
MTYSTTRPHDDAFARLVGALSSDSPRGSSARDWSEHPERFADATSRPWGGPTLRYDSDEHELSAVARRVSREALTEYRAGLIDPKLLRRSLGTRFRIERVMLRAAELLFLGGGDVKRGPSVPLPDHRATQGPFRRAYQGANLH